MSTNGYYEGIPGTRRNFCQVNLAESGDLTVSPVKEVPRDKNHLAETCKIALDLGFWTLFSGDRGNLPGREFFDLLKKYDTLIITLAVNRQRQNLKERSA